MYYCVFVYPAPVKDAPAEDVLMPDVVVFTEHEQALDYSKDVRDDSKVMCVPVLARSIRFR